MDNEQDCNKKYITCPYCNGVIDTEHPKKSCVTTKEYEIRFVICLFIEQLEKEWLPQSNHYFYYIDDDKISRSASNALIFYNLENAKLIANNINIYNLLDFMQTPCYLTISIKSFIPERGQSAYDDIDESLPAYSYNKTLIRTHSPFTSETGWF